MKILLITNPASGGAAKHDRDEVIDALRPLGEVDTVEPGSVEDFGREVSQAARGKDLVVTAGGDGTFNCTVNALFNGLDDVVLGLIPMGTGNDLARTLGLGTDPLEVAVGFDGAPAKTLDVGRASGAGAERFFVNACMGGFPVQVDEALDEGEKEKLGAAAFIWGGAKALADLERSTLRLDGDELVDCVAAGVGNGKSAGGGIEIWPDADPGDGLLDGCALSAAGPTDLVKLAAALKLGDHRDMEGVSMTRGSCVRIDSDPSIEVNVDGELIGLKTPATFEIAASTRILVPQPVAERSR